jgi:surface antigen
VPQIPVGGRQRRVPELGLDQIQRHPLGGELSGVRVPESVRVDALFDPRLGRQAREQHPDVGGLQRAAGDALCVQSDANLVIYSSSHSPLWATMTNVTATVGETVSTNPGPWGECTWGAESMFNGYFLPGRYMNTFGPNNGDAKYWATNASGHRWAIGSIPRIGSMVVFQPGKNGAGWHGHVAWVTEVYPSSNKITIRETNFYYYHGWDTRTIVPASGVQYIYVNP